MSKKPSKRDPRREPTVATEPAVPLDIEDDIEDETMPDDPKTPEEELTHPDPEGKMRSYAPGYGPGPEGSVVELPKEEKEKE